MNDNAPMEDLEQKGIWTRLKESIGFSQIDEEYEEEREVREPGRRRLLPLKIHSASVNHVAVRQTQSIEDARLAADGLKDGRQQIINLEQTGQEMSERIIDFLNGVTYALNGFVEKVGDRVYLFAPSNVVIDVPENLKETTSNFFDN